MTSGRRTEVFDRAQSTFFSCFYPFFGLAAKSDLRKNRGWLEVAILAADRKYHRLGEENDNFATNYFVLAIFRDTGAYFCMLSFRDFHDQKFQTGKAS